MRGFIGLFIFMSIVIAFELYVFNGLKAVFRNGMPRFFKWGYWILVVLPFVWMILWRPFLQYQMGDLKWLGNLFLGLFVTLFVTKLAFSIFLVIEDVYRISKYGGNKLLELSNKENAKAVWDSRRTFISQLGIIVASIPFMSFFYGITRGKYAYTVHRISLTFKDLPAAFDGFKVLQISDVHSGSFDSISAVARGVEMIKEQNADLVLFTGDLVNSRASEIDPYIDLFKSIEANSGKFSVLGNHDYGYFNGDEEEKTTNMQLLERHHEAMGFNLMNNSSVVLKRDGESIRLAGVENWGKAEYFPKRGDLDKAFVDCEEEDEFTILMSHDPSHWKEKILSFKKHVHLTLSGHTHGMQMGVEIPGFKWSPSKWLYPQWAGLYEEGDKKIYVNRGFGFLGFPGRVGILPEITVIELKKELV